MNKTIIKVVVMAAVAIMGVVAEAKSAQDRAVDFIASYETFRAKPYICPGKKNTIGYGCTDAAVVAKGVITEAEAKKILKVRVASDMAWVDSKLPGLNDDKRVALTSLVFNIGRTKFEKSEAYKQLKAKNYKAASKEIAEFRLADGKVMNGLVKRRAAENKLLLA